jgi:serine phosphatase RsbU (regulator of sigma subunit)
MQLRKFLSLTGAALLSVIVFIIDTATKNIDLSDSNFFLFMRTGCVLLSFILAYLFIRDIKRQHARSNVQNISRLALVTGIFLGTYLIVSLLPLKGFKSEDLRLYPLDYLTIFFSSILSIVAGLFAIVTVLYIRDLIFYKRKKTTARNFWFMIALFAAAALSTVTLRPLEDSVLRSIFSGFAIVTIVVNSFRLAWIAYLPRKEKIYSLLYALLAFFGFLAILVILSVQEGWTQKGIHYYSSPLFAVVQLSATLGVIYTGMSFISTLFHLPTAEAFDRKQTEISSLHNLNRLINQVFDLKDLAETATKMVTEVVQATSVWLEIIPSDGTQRKHGLLSVRNISDEDLRHFVDPDRSSLRQIVLQTKKVLMIDDMQDDKRTKHLPTVKQAGSILIIPLLTHDHVIGILYATKEISYGFDQDDVDILSGFADQVAVAIENARLIERSLEKERLQRELLLAQEMQQRLLPQQLPVFPTVDMKAVSSPALEVGGDYYDVSLISDRKIGIIIGDVSGKGVGAAFYMAEVKGIFQSLSKIYESPRMLLSKANDALLTSIDRRSFVSVIYSTLDIRTGAMVIARAGHCPMLYVSGDHKEFVRSNGLGLGLRSGSLFEETIEEKKIKMKKGDVCVFYTDGVTESRSSSGEEFGYERLLDVVASNTHRSADEIKEAVIQTVWQYTDAQGYHDDLTIFVVKWLGE